MQIVEEKLEHSVSEKLKNLPVDTNRALFVKESEIFSVRTRISELHKSSSMKFKTKRTKRLNESKEIIEGINVWKIKE